MDALVTMDVRRLPAIRRCLKIEQRELARRAQVRPDDVSRFESALAPGGLMDRYVEAIGAVAAERQAEARGHESTPPPLH